MSLWSSPAALQSAQEHWYKKKVFIEENPQGPQVGGLKILVPTGSQSSVLMLGDRWAAGPTIMGMIAIGMRNRNYKLQCGATSL